MVDLAFGHGLLDLFLKLSRLRLQTCVYGGQLFLPWGHFDATRKFFECRFAKLALVYAVPHIDREADGVPSAPSAQFTSFLCHLFILYLFSKVTASDRVRSRLNLDQTLVVIVNPTGL